MSCISAGMLQRTKYSRLHDESLSLEDCPEGTLPQKMDCCSESDFALIDPGMPTRQGLSTLKAFIPSHMENMCLQSLVTLRGLRNRTSDVYADGCLSTTDRDSRTNQRLPRQHSQSVPRTGDHSPTHSALSCTKCPVTLNQIRRLSRTHSCPPGCRQRGGLCYPGANDDRMSVQTTSIAVHHDIKYMGCVEVTRSMRTLDFDTRTQVTREAINRLCKKVSAKSTVKTKKLVSKRQSAVLGAVNLQFSGNRIVLCVSTDSVTLIAASSSQKIAHHPMQAISFAYGGDPDMADFVAYVAKDHVSQRACHILECPQGQAGEVISSIRQAFDACFCQLLSHTSSIFSTDLRLMTLCHNWSPVRTITGQNARSDHEAGEPGDFNVIQRGGGPAGGTEQLINTPEDEEAGRHDGKVHESRTITEGSTAPSTDSEASAQWCTLRSGTLIRDLIQDEVWFHGRLGREQAESLLIHSGDFLVRDSGSGQYVLSGMEGTTLHHVLLVDPHGQVRTPDQVFLTVGHLVRFHMKNQMPIFSGSCKLCLKQPVLH